MQDAGVRELKLRACRRDHARVFLSILMETGNPRGAHHRRIT